MKTEERKGGARRKIWEEKKSIRKLCTQCLFMKKI